MRAEAGRTASPCGEATVRIARASRLISVSVPPDRIISTARRAGAERESTVKSIGIAADTTTAIMTGMAGITTGITTVTMVIITARGCYADTGAVAIALTSDTTIITIPIVTGSASTTVPFTIRTMT